MIILKGSTKIENNGERDRDEERRDEATERKKDKYIEKS
jgi:hypothetical protein